MNGNGNADRNANGNVSGHEHDNRSVNADYTNASRVLLEEAVDYFRSEKGFSRLLTMMIQKYQRLGRWGGTVTLAALTEDEQEALSNFFRQDYYWQRSLQVSLESFAVALVQTRFGAIPVLELMEGINGAPLRTQAQMAEEKETAKREFWTAFQAQYPAPFCQSWLKAIQGKEVGTRGVHLAYDRNPAQLRERMGYVLEALAELCRRTEEEPGYERLSLFASRITKDPHGFDQDTEQGRLLISALEVLRGKGEISLEIAGVTPEDEKCTTNEDITCEDDYTIRVNKVNELYYEFGLLRDDILNFVTCTGLIALDAEERPLPVWLAAYEQPAVLNVPLREVVKSRKVVPGNGLDGGKVFVVENSGVFSALVDRLEQDGRQTSVPGSLALTNRPYSALVCTHGQFKLATLVLLDRLAENGCQIYYSGDFDPEGVLMLKRLMLRYPGRVTPWRFSVEDYRASLSHEVLSPSRLKQLAGTTEAELVAVIEEMCSVQKAGYQEGLIGRLWEDIRLLSNVK